MMQFGNMTGWGMAFWWIGGLIMMGLFIWFIITMIKRTTNNIQTQSESALDLLKKRYARGEISKEEFDQISKDLRS